MSSCTLKSTGQKAQSWFQPNDDAGQPSCDPHQRPEQSEAEQLHERATEDQLPWLQRFWAGDRELLGAIYEEHFCRVERAVRRVLRGADVESVVHEVFFRLVAERPFRERFRGGSLGGWLATVGRNRAIDLIRRRSRESSLEVSHLRKAKWRAEADETLTHREARDFVAHFKDNVLPAKYRAVFEARFIQELTQREAAAALDMPRTSLAYQESNIRQLLALEQRQHAERAAHIH